MKLRDDAFMEELSLIPVLFVKMQARKKERKK